MRPSVRRPCARTAVVPSALVLSIGIAAACLTQGGAHASTLVDPVAVPTATAPTITTPTAPTIPTLPSTPASADALADLVLEQSGFTVYPVHDGYLDSVEFVVSAVDAAGVEVAASGTATLTHDGATVTTWSIDGAQTVLDWDGRVAGRIEPGRYDLVVDARSADGTERSATTTVEVSDQHLVHHSLTVDYPVTRERTSVLMPMAVVEAAELGPVRLRVRTVAAVHRRAVLVVQDDGMQRALELRTGTHTSDAHTVPRGFEEVVITHDWAKGAADLKTLTAIWEFDALE